jgi:hypothetical protein
MRVGGLDQQTCSWVAGFPGIVGGLAAARLAKRRRAKSASYLRAYPFNRPENYVFRFISWTNRGSKCISPIQPVLAKTRLDSERRWIRFRGGRCRWQGVFSAGPRTARCGARVLNSGFADAGPRDVRARHVGGAPPNLEQLLPLPQLPPPERSPELARTSVVIRQPMCTYRLLFTQ